MTNKGKRELLEAVQPRYFKASKARKSQILVEFASPGRTGQGSGYPLRPPWSGYPTIQPN